MIPLTKYNLKEAKKAAKGESFMIPNTGKNRRNRRYEAKQEGQNFKNNPKAKLIVIGQNKFRRIVQVVVNKYGEKVKTIERFQKA